MTWWCKDPEFQLLCYWPSLYIRQGFIKCDMIFFGKSLNHNITYYQNRVCKWNWCISILLQYDVGVTQKCRLEIIWLKHKSRAHKVMYNGKSSLDCFRSWSRHGFPRDRCFVWQIHQSPMGSPRNRPVIGSIDVYFVDCMHNMFNKGWFASYFKRSDSHVTSL